MQVSPSGMASASQADSGEFDSRHLLHVPADFPKKFAGFFLQPMQRAGGKDKFQALRKKIRPGGQKIVSAGSVASRQVFPLYQSSGRSSEAHAFPLLKEVSRNKSRLLSAAQSARMDEDVLSSCTPAPQRDTPSETMLR